MKTGSARPPQKGFFDKNLITPPGEGHQKITTAVLLAAGRGYRLRPVTDDAPKCLTEIGGTSILERLVHGLQLNGIKKLIVVVGHMQDSIRDFFAASSTTLEVEFVYSPDYLTTNTIYSLWMARKHIQDPFVLVESDLIFDASLLAPMLSPDKIAVSPILDWMNGTSVTMDQRGRVEAFYSSVNPEQVTGSPPRKTVNMYSLSWASWKRVEERLDLYIAAGRVQEYYEVVFSEMVQEKALSLEAVTFSPNRWYEVDTLLDLDEAERLFPAPGARRSTQLPASQ